MNCTFPWTVPPYKILDKRRNILGDNHDNAVETENEFSVRLDLRSIVKVKRKFVTFQADRKNNTNC